MVEWPRCLGPQADLKLPHRVFDVVRPGGSVTATVRVVDDSGEADLRIGLGVDAVTIIVCPSDLAMLDQCSICWRTRDAGRCRACSGLV